MRTSLLNKRSRFNATLTTTMHPRKRYLLDPGFSDIRILKEVGRSDASLIFEIELDGEKYAMKLVGLEPPLPSRCSRLSFMIMGTLDIQRKGAT
jgi:hypothetical protein